MQFITYNELNKDIIKNIHKIPQDIDLIVGIPRSGLMLACMIGLYMNKPIADLDTFLNKSFFSVGNTKDQSKIVSNYTQIKKIVVVEDTVCSGKSICDAKKKVISNISSVEVLYLAAYTHKNTSNLVDIYFKNIDDDRAFEWNYMHNTLLERACIDIDGVLCVDPTEEQNDDGKKYKEFLINADTKLLPTRKVGYIVTSRLEKYRPETEQWLKEHNICYKKLFMMNIATARERQIVGNHAAFKAHIFKQLKDTIWFIESCDYQARDIAQSTGKAVFCVESHCFFPENYVRRTKVRLKHNLIHPLKNRLKLYLLWLKHGR